MNLGIMLLRRSGKQGSLKFIVTLTAAALGTLILLFVFSIANAMNSSFQRTAWQSVLSKSNDSTLSSQAIHANDAVIYTAAKHTSQTFLNKPITVMNLHFTGGKLPAGSPLDTYPAAGEYYVSPALAQLIDSYPSDALKNRFEGNRAGIIPLRALGSPDELLMINGISMDKLNDESSFERQNAVRVTDFSQGAQSQTQQMTERTIAIAMTIGAIGLIIPVVMLLMTATALGAKEREARYAALRLIGATRRQIRGITFIDSVMASAVGIAAGSVAYFVLRPLLFGVRVNGLRFFPEEISVAAPLFMLFIAIIFGIVWLSNWIGMRKVITSPLGVAKRQTLSKPPRFFRAIPLLACLAAMVYMASLSKKAAYAAYGDAYPNYLLILFALIILSLLLAGGWIIKLYGALLGRVVNSARGLLVSQRIKHEARKTFQGIGGVVAAFFTAAFFVTSLATLASLADAATPLFIQALPDNSVILEDVTAKHNEELFDQAVHATNGYDNSPVTVLYGSDSYYLMSCRDVERVFKQTCTNVDQYVQIPSINNGTPLDVSKTVDITTKGVIVQKIYLPKAPGSVLAVDAEKIVTQNYAGGGTGGVTVVNASARVAAMNNVLGSFKDLLYAGVVLTVIVASLNLVVATSAGLFDRKGSFFTLRLAGADVKLLESTVLMESLLPLVLISLISIGLGLYMAYIFLKLVSDTLRMAFALPDLTFWLCVVGMFVVSYAGIRLVLPLLKRITSIENNRTE